MLQIKPLRILSKKTIQYKEIWSEKPILRWRKYVINKELHIAFSDSQALL